MEYLSNNKCSWEEKGILDSSKVHREKISSEENLSARSGALPLHDRERRRSCLDLYLRKRKIHMQEADALSPEAKDLIKEQ